MTVGRNNIATPIPNIEFPPNAPSSFFRPNAITANIPPINIAVIAFSGATVVTLDKAQEEIAIPKAIAGSIIGRKTTALVIFPISLPKAPISFFIPKDRTTNIPAISMAVSALTGAIVTMFDNTQDETVIPIAMNTSEADARADSFRPILSAATFSKALATSTIPMDSPMTESMSTLPTILNAIPIARTPTAINNIVPTPFFMLLSCALLPPAVSKSLFLSPADFFDNCIIVS